MSVRVFLCRKTEQKMYREPFLMKSCLLYTIISRKSNRIDENLESKTNYTQPIIYCTIDQKKSIPKNIWNGFL
jgi:hypothetical protein